MNAIKNMLQFVNNNWAWIVVVIALIVYVALRIRKHFTDADNKDFDIAKAQVANVILRLVAGAEEEYKTVRGAGAIKRAQVIAQIYENYPILSRIVDQEAVTTWIDTLIDDALGNLRRIAEKNKENADKALEV